MSYYHGDIPSFSKRSPTMKTTSTSTTSSSRMSSAPSNLTIPSASSNASSTDSYVQQTFRDFASHAKRCERCCDPLMSYLEKTEMCPRGRHLAKLVTTSLFDEANEMYKAKHGGPRRKHGKGGEGDGWQHLEVDIPKGCESVRSLLQAIDRGLQLPASAASSPNMSSSHSRNSSNGSVTSSSSPRVVLGESYEYVAAPPSRHHSDEEHRRSRRRDRDEEKHRRHRSHSAGGRSRRHSISQAVVGVEERDRRPYGGGAVVHSTRHLAPGSPRSSHDNVSIDSGYSTANGCPSPDISRGSQYALDMERRQQRRSTTGPAIPRSALKKTSSFEHLHPHYSSKGHTRTPSSPRANKHATVGFNIEGHYYAPGYP